MMLQNQPGMEEKQEVLFSQVLEAWLAQRKDEVKTSTLAHYRQTIHRHIIPALGHIPLSQLTGKMADDFLREKLHTGRVDGSGALSPKTVADIRTILRMVLEFAGQMETGFQVQGDLFYPRVRQQAVTVLSLQEQRQLENVLFNGLDPMKAGILCALYMGLRIGEVCALQWKDVLLDQGVVHVRKTVQRVQLVDEQGASFTRLMLDRPKTDASVRLVPIPQFLIAPFRRLRQAGDCYVLTGEDKPMEPRVCLTRYKRILSKAGVRNYTFHALRHTFATRCVESGFDIKSLSEILGHTHVNITLQRYVHPSLEMKKQQMERLSQLHGTARIRVK